MRPAQPARPHGKQVTALPGACCIMWEVCQMQAAVRIPCRKISACMSRDHIEAAWMYMAPACGFAASMPTTTMQGCDDACMLPWPASHRPWPAAAMDTESLAPEASSTKVLRNQFNFTERGCQTASYLPQVLHQPASSSCTHAVQTNTDACSSHSLCKCWLGRLGPSL